METIKELLDAAKKSANVETDYALAKILGIPRQRISDYYKGERFPEPFVCLQLSKVLNRPKDEIDSIVQIEAEKDEKRRNVWKDYLKRIGGIAASIALLFFLSVTLIVTSTPAEASNGKGSKAEHFVLCKLRHFFRKAISSVLHTLANAFPRYGYLN